MCAHVCRYVGQRLGLFLPAIVRPILHSLEAFKQVKALPLTDVATSIHKKLSTTFFKQWRSISEGYLDLM
ncbi:unnamed protein product [Brassica napus]|uniref:(rape) hypothetical protein n=1 Tax=Brassica napus TaxID=3708 RepID=A0A816IXY2_BRANA|nr:unnamed protein product [Brassica napus]